MDLGPHAVFIVASYATVTVVIAALVVWLLLDGRTQQKTLDELESRGIKRRSGS